MSSSTSSSEPIPRGRGLRIALMIAAALIVIEWGTRAELMPGTSDLARYRQFPDAARALAAAPAPRIALIGNSVTDRVQLDVLKEEWRRLTGKTPSVEKFIAYYSNLPTWHRMYAQYFWKPELNPDVVVITIYDGSALADSEVMDVGNLALFFTGPEDRASLFEHESNRSSTALITCSRRLRRHSRRGTGSATARSISSRVTGRSPLRRTGSTSNTKVAASGPKVRHRGRSTRSNPSSPAHATAASRSASWRSRCGRDPPAESPT